MIDFCNTNDTIILEQDIDNILQQIDILLDTNPRDVLGEPSYGCDYIKFLWETNISNNGIAKYIENHIKSTIDLLSFTLNVECQSLQGQENDIIIIYIKIIAPDGYFFQKIYNIS